MKQPKDVEGAIDLSLYQVRTDLALEAHQMAMEQQEQEQQRKALTGVKVDEFEEEDIIVTKVHIAEGEGAQALGKTPGTYLTLQAQGLRNKDSEFQHKVTKLFAKQFSQFLVDIGISQEAHCLIVGLGNRNVTPDALGPFVVENVLVTSHLFELAPEDVQEGFRPVSAVSPGVLGITGIETSEIVQGIIRQVQPDFVIAVDALAARSIERVNTTIQISDTGIHPGSGIGNKRKSLSKKTLGIPVIAIGVPTVVDAVSIVSDTLDYVLGHLGKEMRDRREGSNARRALAPGGMNFRLGKAERFNPGYIPNEEGKKTIMGLVGTLPEQDKRQLIYEVLRPLGHHLIVTPKEVDNFIEDMANVLASGLNAALHQSVDPRNMNAYTH